MMAAVHYVACRVGLSKISGCLIFVGLSECIFMSLTADVMWSANWNGCGLLEHLVLLCQSLLRMKCMCAFMLCIVIVWRWDVLLCMGWP